MEQNLKEVVSICQDISLIDNIFLAFVPSSLALSVLEIIFHIFKHFLVLKPGQSCAAVILTTLRPATILTKLGKPSKKLHIFGTVQDFLRHPTP